MQDKMKETKIKKEERINWRVSKKFKEILIAKAKKKKQTITAYLTDLVIQD